MDRLAPVDALARRPLTIVALGASAGGVHALQDFFSAMPADDRFAFVVITHLSPHYASQMAEILARRTAMPVSEAQDDELVQPGHVYVIPPDRYMGIREGKLTLVVNEPRPASPRPIDHFMSALAEDQQEHAVGIVLSGADHDGAIGLKEIKAVGGLVLVQEPAEAEFTGMPTSAIATAAVDAAVPVAKMAQILLSYVQHADLLAPEALAADAAEDDGRSPVLAEILALVLERTGRDFNWYRRPMLLRRLRRRMGLCGLSDVAEYLALLRAQPDELRLLVKDFLISVTEFFRQPEAWQALGEQVLPSLIDERVAVGEGVRVWTPGCATGEESYSIAMLLLEPIGSRGAQIPLNVIGSDIDVDALDVARAGAYPEAIAGAMAPARLARFFDHQGGRFVVRKQLRESVLFAPQDLLRDPPFSKLDVIVCRNLLIYLEPAQQNRVLEAFHFALNPGGVLFLGKAESLGQQTDLFEALSRPHRIFKRLGGATRAEWLFKGRWSGPGGFLDPMSRSRHAPAMLPADIVRKQLAGRSPDAALLLDRESRVLYFHGHTADYFEPRGEPTTNLSQLLLEGLRRGVRAIVQDARASGGAAAATMTARRDDRNVRVRAQVEPVGDFQRDGLMLISLQDERESAQPVPSTGDAPLDEEVHRLRHEIAAIEREGEVTTAELRIAHEEAMSLNEELQSSNEELQTSKEELQSMNEELSSVNSQLEEKVAELERALGDLRNLMDSTRVATLFLDPDLRIRRFTEPARRLFYLIAADEGRPLRDIASCVKDPTLLGDATAVHDGSRPVERTVVADDGLQYLRRILPYRTRDDRIDGVVITYTDITAVQNAAADVRRLAAVLSDSNDAVIVYDFDGRIRSWNRAAQAAYGYDQPTAQGLPISALEPEGQAGQAMALATQVRQAASVGPVSARRVSRDGRVLDVTVTVSALRDDAGVAYAVASTERDVSEKLKLEAEVRFRAMADLIPALLKIEDEEGSAEFVNRAWLTFTGLPSTEPLLGRGWQSQVHPDDLKPYLQGLRKARAEGRRFEGDARMRGGDGGYRWTRTLDAIRQDEAGMTIGYVSLTLDIEERKRAEQLIAQEAARKDEFLAMLAHELRNPLAPIGNAVALIDHSEVADPKTRWATGVISRQVQQLARLVNDLMDIARVSSGKVKLNREPVDLRQVIEQARDMTEPPISARAQKLEISMPDAPIVVEGDLLRLTQVVSNLLVNASKYSERGERIHLEVATEEGEAVLRVRDNGAGISAEMLPRVFDLFVQENKTLDRAQGGLGIGLTLVQRLVAAHHGTVKAKSDGPGRGAEFIVRLPVLALPSVAAQARVAAAAPATGACRVLVVDDNADSADTLAMLLKQAGHEVDTAHDGPDALAVAARTHPEVVVLDIGLPGMTGYEVARSMRESSKTAKALIIALTGYGRPEDSQRAEAAGFDFHLVKPVVPERLLELVSSETVRLRSG